MNNVVNLDTYRNKSKYVLFLFSEEMPLTIVPKQSLWLLHKGYYWELYKDSWALSNNDVSSYFKYENEAIDIIEAYDLDKLKSVISPYLFDSAKEASRKFF